MFCWSIVRGNKERFYFYLVYFKIAYNGCVRHGHLKYLLICSRIPFIDDHQVGMIIQTYLYPHYYWSSAVVSKLDWLYLFPSCLHNFTLPLSWFKKIVHSSQNNTIFHWTLFHKLCFWTKICLFHWWSIQVLELWRVWMSLYHSLFQLSPYCALTYWFFKNFFKLISSFRSR